VPLARAIGEVIYSGGRIATAQGRLVGPDGTLYAHATTTCIVLDAR
jgi:acyl-coenzyme A thioesterase PaaI-like protein